MLYKAINATSSGDNVVIPGVADKVIQIWAIVLVSGLASTITLKDDTTAITGGMSFAANGQLVFPYIGLSIFDTLGTGNDFVINKTGLGGVNGWIMYTQA